VLEPGGQPRQVEVAEHRRVLEVVAFLADAREAQDRELTGGEAQLERLDSRPAIEPSATCASTPCGSRSVA